MRQTAGGRWVNLELARKTLFLGGMFFPSADTKKLCQYALDDKYRLVSRSHLDMNLESRFV